MLAFLQRQLTATFARHGSGKDTVQLQLGDLVIAALREFAYNDDNPELGGSGTNRKLQLRFPTQALNGAQFHVDFEIGDQCFVNGPIQLVTQGTLDETKWELKYYRESADGLLATVGLGSND